MKTAATLLLVLALATPAGAAVIWNEPVNGDLSTIPAAPTPLVFALGGNTINGSVRNSGQAPASGDRDFITFTIPVGQKLVGLRLLAWSTAIDFGFCAFNAGPTSFVPSAVTDPSFLAGIHFGGVHVGTDVLPLFVSEAVTSNALPAAELPPGQYCWVIQQTTNITSSYSFEFLVDASTPARPTTWGTIKQLYQ